MTTYKSKDFPKEILKGLTWGENTEGFTEVSSLETGKEGRWAIGYELIFKDPAGDTYSVSFRRGATECQDEEPFEYEPEMVTCLQVREAQKTITVWEPIPNDD